MTLPTIRAPRVRVSGQTAVACLIVVALCVIALALVWAGVIDKAWASVSLPLGVALGALANALTPPRDHPPTSHTDPQQ